MWIPDLIQKKRDGATLADDEIRFFIDQLVHRRMENSQLGKQPFFRQYFSHDVTVDDAAHVPAISGS